MAALFISFVAVAPADAKGPVDVFGSAGDLGGQFSAANGGPMAAVAVNSAGNGAAGVGDVYVVDRSNHRIQRFDADGNFISAWGQDVDSLAAGTGFEICTVAANCKAGSTGTTGGAMNNPRGVAVDQASGAVYVSDSTNRRIQKFDAEGNPLLVFGKDVVKTGQPGNNPAASAQQTLMVTATGGKYTLEFEGQQTAELAFDAAAASIQLALEGLGTIGSGNVAVSGGPAPAAYLVVFKGTHANNPEPDIAASSGTGEPLSGGGASVSTTTPGSNGFEVCNAVGAAAANCQAGVAAGATTAGAFSSTSLGIGSLTVAPVGAPNTGNVLVADAASKRVQEFSSSGGFVRAFGWDVTLAGPGNSGVQFEVCNAAAFDACKAGAEGSGVGQFGRTGAATEGPNKVTEDAAGNIYTVESGANFRVQRFTLPGNVVTPVGSYNPEGRIAGSKKAGDDDADTPIDVAADPAGFLYVLKYFPQGSGTPPLASAEARILKVDPTSNGGAGGVVDTFLSGAELGPVTPTTGLGLNFSTDRLYVTRPSGTTPQVYIVDEILGLAVEGVEATEVGASTATLNAVVTPASIPLHTFYRFEYRRSGSGEEWTKAPSAAAVDIGNTPLPQEVSQQISGLELEVAYEFRVVAFTQLNGEIRVVQAPVEITTHPTPPAVSTGGAFWSSPLATNPSLLLGGTINPGRARTTYYFEYVSEEAFQDSGFATAIPVPGAPAEAGNGAGNVLVRRSVTGLDAVKSYRYRLVATNPIGTRIGSARQVEPPSATGRFYELVSNDDSWGSGVSGFVEGIATGGDRVAFTSLAMGQPESLPGPGSPYLASRGEGGWKVEALFPDPERPSDGGIAGAGSQSSASLTRRLWTESSLGERLRAETQFGFSELDGAHVPASEQIVPLNRTGEFGRYKIEGVSSDLSRIVFSPSAANFLGGLTLLPGEPLLVNDHYNLYSISGAGGPNPVLSIVNRADGQAGELLGGTCGAGLGATSGASEQISSRAVSIDGSVVYFNAREGAPAEETCTAFIEPLLPKRIYKRIGNTTTVEISVCAKTTPTCTTEGNDEYKGASADGSVVFFTTTRQLTDSDTDSSADLYVYDATPPAGEPKMVQVSAGEAVAVDHPTPGFGGEARGLVDNSADGSRAYFVAKGRLTSEATKGANNLYVYERSDVHPGGRISYIAALPGDDEDPVWGQGNKDGGRKVTYALPIDGTEGDGRFLVFVSAGALVPADGDTSTDLYRYDDSAPVGERLQCASCAGDGEFGVTAASRPTKNSTGSYEQEGALASEDVSSLVFVTGEKLVAGDENDGSDAYMWSEGELELISGGTEGYGVSGAGRGATISRDGRNVFFMTRAPLVASDTNNAVDIYDARVGGGFPTQPIQEPCRGSGSCQPATNVTLPAEPGGSESFSGPGNQAPPKSCKKGFVLKKGKCVKESSRHGQRQKGKRAGHDRGGVR